LAATGFGAEGRELVSDESPAAAGEDGQQAGKPCPQVSTGGKRVYTRNRREAKKLIPEKMLSNLWPVEDAVEKPPLFRLQVQV
jgi:hypothetical protein